MKLLIASNNKGKLKEIKSILGSEYNEILTPEDIQLNLEVVEDGETFLENAIKKARAFMQASGIDCVADDSGLCVEALNGAPGVHSARFASEHATDEQNNNLLMKKMRKHNNKNAKFVSCIVLIKKDGTIYSAQGESKGIILDKPCGTGGFGYDPLFFDETFQKTYAQLTQKEKNSMSHRGKALKKLRDVLIEDSRGVDI